MWIATIISLNPKQTKKQKKKKKHFHSEKFDSLDQGR